MFQVSTLLDEVAKNACGVPNSVNPDLTAPEGAVWSGSTLFAQCL